MTSDHDPVLVAEMAGLLNEAGSYAFPPVDEQVGYLDRRAQLLHRLVDALGDEGSRYLAQDAQDRANRARDVTEADRALGPRSPAPGADDA